MMENLVVPGYDVTVLTNLASDTFRKARGHFSFLENKRDGTTSGDVGSIKLERRIYISM